MMLYSIRFWSKGVPDVVTWQHTLQIPILLGKWSKFARACWSDPDVLMVYSLVAFVTFALVD